MSRDFKGLGSQLPGRDELVWMYRKMLEIRHFEEKVGELYWRGVIPGPAHLYIGEEAVAVGICANLRPDDYVASNHRGHGHFIAKGARLDRTMAELLGKETGYCKGRSGSMHLARVEGGCIHVSTSIVAAGVPIAAGLGLSIKLRGSDQVVVCFFGDVATNQGVFHEGINIASIWSLPVIFVCENNRYATLTPVTYSTKVKRIADRGVAYGIPGITVDGTDVLKVYEAAKEVVERVRGGGGPVLMECVTNRWRPHSEGMKENRPPSELEEMKRQCPIKRLRKTLLEMGVLTEEEVEGIEREVLEEVEEAVRFAVESKDPDPEGVADYVYA